MRLKNYKKDLLKRLRDPEYAAEYLAQVLAEKDSADFLIALEDVVEPAAAWVIWRARWTQASDSSQILSKNGNPTLETFAGNFETVGAARFRGFG